MKKYTAQLTDAVLTAPILNAAGVGHPEIIERITKQICDEYCFYFTGMALGYGRYATSGEIKAAGSKLMIGNNNVTWAVQTRTRQLVTLQVQINSGSGGGGAAQTMTLGPNDNWIQPGMTLKYTFSDTGSYILFYIVSGPVTNGSNWDYQVKIESSSSTTVPENIIVGATLGQTTIAVATCTTSTTYMPNKLPDQYVNYNTTMKPKMTLCKDGIATVTWFESVDGQKCWTPTEIYQFEMETLLDLEMGIVYGESTVNNSGTIYITDANGNSVMKGDGFLAQIASGNNIVYNVNTYYQQASNYDLLRNQIEDAVENWSILYGVTGNVTMYVHCGTKAFGLLQNVLKGYADQSGGCCFIYNYRTGDMEEMGLSKNIIRYKWSTYELVLLKCAVFDNPAVHGTPQMGNYAVANPPLESFRFIIAPDSDCEGYPLMQLFFRGGCGLDDIWNNNFTPGTIDPTGILGGTYTNGYRAKINVNDFSGFSIGKEIEYNYIVRDPSKFLNFTPFQA